MIGIADRMTVSSFGRQRTAGLSLATGIAIALMSPPGAAQNAEPSAPSPTRPIDFRLPPAEDGRTPGVQGPSDNGLPPVAPGERSGQPTPTPAPTLPAPRTATPPRVTPTQPETTPMPAPPPPRGAASAPTAVRPASPTENAATPGQGAAGTLVAPPPPIPPASVDDAAPSGDDAPSMDAAPARASGDAPIWAWLLAVIAAVAAGWWYWRRRPLPATGQLVEDRPKSALPPASDPTPSTPLAARSATPAPAEPPAPATSASPRRASPLVTRPAAEQRAIVAMALDIRSIRFATDHVAVGFALNLLNQGPVAATGLMVRIALNQGSAMPESVLNRFFDGAGGSVLRDDMTLPPGAGEALSGEVMLPRAAIEPLMIGGKPMLVPVMAFDVTYHWDGDGDAFGQNAGSFVLGREQGASGSDKLAPLALDRPAYVIDRPGARATAMKRSQ